MDAEEFKAGVVGLIEMLKEAVASNKFDLTDLLMIGVFIRAKLGISHEPFPSKEGSG